MNETCADHWVQNLAIRTIKLSTPAVCFSLMTKSVGRPSPTEGKVATSLCRRSRRRVDFTRDCVGVFAVPLPLCRGRLYACVPNGFVSGLRGAPKASLCHLSIPHYPFTSSSSIVLSPSSAFFSMRETYEREMPMSLPTSLWGRGPPPVSP